MQAQDFSQPDQFPHPIADVQYRETHISIILLTGEWVYKIKKPVNFGFLDFSTLEKRRYYCEEEIRLNRRSAPDLYVSVEPIYEDQGRFNFQGQGEVVDYAVKMRQFDPEALMLNRMDELASNGLFMRDLGYALAAFHELTEPSKQADHYGSAANVLMPVEENFRQIESRLGVVEEATGYEAIKQWSLDQWERLSAFFEKRKADGFVRECHGDLHLQNIAVIDGKAVMFDCIEFNDQFRWIDVASDLAFLLMDLEIHGYDEQANVILNSYLEYSGDYSLLSVLDFYRVYRAMVRAKVALLRMEQAEAEEVDALKLDVRRHLDFALSAVKRAKPILIITCGVSGSGKSTLASSLAARIQAVQLRSDVIRKQMVGLKPLESSADLEADDPDALYSQPYTEKTFNRLQTLAQEITDYGYPVIVDATFISHGSRSSFQKLAASNGLPYYILYFDVPVAVLRERILSRQRKKSDASEAGVDVMEKQLENFEDFDADERVNVYVVHSDVGIEQVVGWIERTC